MFIGYQLQPEIAILRFELRNCTSSFQRLEILSTYLSSSHSPKPIHVFIWHVHSALLAYRFQPSKLDTSILQNSLNHIYDYVFDSSTIVALNSLECSVECFLSLFKVPPLFDINENLIDVLSAFLSSIAQKRLSFQASELLISTVSTQSTIVHSVGTSGFFSEVDQLIAITSLCGFRGLSLSVQFSPESPYIRSPYFQDLIANLSLSTHLISGISSQKLLSDIRIQQHYLVPELLSYIISCKQKIYKEVVFPAFLNLFHSISHPSHSSIPSSLLSLLYTNSSHFALFIRSGDKHNSETLPAPIREVAQHLSHLLLQDSNKIPLNGFLLGDSSVLVEDLRASSGSVFHVGPIFSCSSHGYNNSTFLFSSPADQLLMQNIVVFNYLLLSQADYFCADLLSNLALASYFTNNSSYKPMLQWPTAPIYVW